MDDGRSWWTCGSTSSRHEVCFAGGPRRVQPGSHGDLFLLSSQLMLLPRITFQIVHLHTSPLPGSSFITTQDKSKRVSKSHMCRKMRAVGRCAHRGKHAQAKPASYNCSAVSSLELCGFENALPSPGGTCPDPSPLSPSFQCRENLSASGLAGE